MFFLLEVKKPTGKLSKLKGYRLEKMDEKQQCIKKAGYDVAEDFMVAIAGMDISTGIKIAEFIEKNFSSLQASVLVSKVLGGLVMDDDNEPITFGLEFIRNESEFIVLSDLKLISMDEYLDLMNLKQRI
jgi:hypothetical protein